jgi:hypothetical protein
MQIVRRDRKVHRRLTGEEVGYFQIRQFGLLSEPRRPRPGHARPPSPRPRRPAPPAPPASPPLEGDRCGLRCTGRRVPWHIWQPPGTANHPGYFGGPRFNRPWRRDELHIGIPAASLPKFLEFRQQRRNAVSEFSRQSMFMSLELSSRKSSASRSKETARRMHI